MSANDGIYIVKVQNQLRNSGCEYRVSWAMAIDNVDAQPQEIADWYRWELFGNAASFSTEKEALEWADILEQGNQTEYGVVSLGEWCRPLNRDAKDPWTTERKGLYPRG